MRTAICTPLLLLQLSSGYPHPLPCRCYALRNGHLPPALILPCPPPSTRHDTPGHENWCGDELFDGTSARRLWRRHSSAAHLSLSPHLVLKVLVCGLEIIYLLEQQLAQRVFVLLVPLRTTSIRACVSEQTVWLRGYVADGKGLASGPLPSN